GRTGATRCTELRQPCDRGSMRHFASYRAPFPQADADGMAAVAWAAPACGAAGGSAQPGTILWACDDDPSHAGAGSHTVGNQDAVRARVTYPARAGGGGGLRRGAIP